MVKLGGLWLSKTKSGQMMLSGGLGTAKIIILRNTKKIDKQSKQPDYYIFLADRIKRDAQADMVSTVVREEQEEIF